MVAGRLRRKCFRPKCDNESRISSANDPKRTSPAEKELSDSCDYGQRPLAEREGFEPPIPLRVCRISSAVLSTTQPPLRSPKPTKKAANGRRYLPKGAGGNKRDKRQTRLAGAILPPGTT